MYSIKLDWKSFNLSLEDLETWMRGNTDGNYAGNSADSALRLWFTAEPDQDVKDAIQAYWDGLTDASTEAIRYLPAATIASAIESLRTGLLSKSWDAMSVAERKLVVGQTPTREELGL